MSLAKEYSNQSTWRNWNSYLKELRIENSDTIFDFGCSIGTVTKLFAQKASQVIGVDNNPELLQFAIDSNYDNNILYQLSDLGSIENLGLPIADGIWTSFTAAYFPNFTPVLNNWLTVLKPNGWIAIVEMSGLYAHKPLSKFTSETFTKYYKRQRRKNMYDFEMGSCIKDFLINAGLSVEYEEDKQDKELTFCGPAEPEILKAWECRFNRMFKFREYVGEDVFRKIKEEFLNCLSNENHISDTIVKFIIAKK